MLPSVLPPRRHGLLSETRNKGFSHLPFLLTQVLVRNCSTRYEFLTNGSRWESRTAVPGIFCPPVSIHACILFVHACMHFVRVHYDSPISALLKRRSHPVGRTTGEASCAPAIQTSVKFRDFADLQLPILRCSFQPCWQIWGRFFADWFQSKERVYFFNNT